MNQLIKIPKSEVNEQVNRQDDLGYRLSVEDVIENKLNEMLKKSQVVVEAYKCRFNTEQDCYEIHEIKLKSKLCQE